MTFSKEYVIAIALLVGAVLKLFGIEIENSAIEATILGIGSLILAILRKRKGDINFLGVKR